MSDFDVWLMHEYFSVYFCLHAQDENDCIRMVSQRLDEEGLPGWVYDDAQKIRIEKVGEFIS